MDLLPVTLSTIAGVVILAVTIADLVITTVTVSGGAGPVTRRLTPGIWRVVLRVHRRWRNHRLLR